MAKLKRYDDVKLTCTHCGSTSFTVDATATIDTANNVLVRVEEGNNMIPFCAACGEDHTENLNEDITG